MNNNSSQRYNVEEIDNEQNIKINATEEIEDFNYIREKLTDSSVHHDHNDIFAAFVKRYFDALGIG